MVEDVAKIKHELHIPIYSDGYVQLIFERQGSRGKNIMCFRILNETFDISQIASDVNLKHRGDPKGRS